MELKKIDPVEAKRKRVENWKRIKSLGIVYTRAYLILAAVSVLLIVVGIILTIASVSAGPGLILFGFIAAFVGLGVMTVIANVVYQAKVKMNEFRQLKEDFKGKK